MECDKSAQARSGSGGSELSGGGVETGGNRANKKGGTSRGSSRISGFYQLDWGERLGVLKERGYLTDEDVEVLERSEGALDYETADSMIENAVGVFGLPMGLGLNFVVNGREYVVPMAIEEPSVLAAVSHSAKIVRKSGGFEANCTEPLMIGQIQIVDVDDPEATEEQILAATDQLIASANDVHPKMVERGGGAKGLEVRQLEGPSGKPMVVVHLLVHVCDAMGANMVNSMAEHVAPRIGELTDGRVSLRILSNLADHRRVKATCRIPLEDLAWKEFSGRDVARGVVEASEFAEADPYRAATHNKGVMNGMGAVCIATGNDWRAMEAGAHAFCCRDGKYGPMTRWLMSEDGEALIGELEVPIQVGTVGGPTRLHPMAQVAQRILDVSGASELGEVMGAVGLAQNLAALKALGTEGIQSGHMALHARSVAATVGASDEEMEWLVGELIDRDEVTVSVARDLLEERRGG